MWSRWAIFSLLLWTMAVGRTRSQDCLGSPEGEENEDTDCTLGKAMANLFHFDTLMSCPACPEKPERPENPLAALWNHTRGLLLVIPTRFTAVTYGAYNDIRSLQWGVAVLEFTMGFCVTCVLLCLVASCTGRHDDTFYDVVTSCHVSSKPSGGTKMKTSSEKSADPSPAHVDDIQGNQEFGDTSEPPPNEQNVGSCGEGATENGRTFDEEMCEAGTGSPVFQELESTSPEPSPVDDLNPVDQDGWSTVDESLDSSQQMKPFRPSPPTVMVYSLHKPEEIPDDIMSALLCLNKSCCHDHSSIRLIGPKVIVYPAKKSPRSRSKRRTTRHSKEPRTCWTRGESPPVVGQPVLSDEFEVQEDTINATTQTDAVESPRSVVIRTEAIVCGENDEPASCNRSSMTGTLLIAKDSFDTKFVGCEWSEPEVSGKEEMKTPSWLTSSGVRESFVKSRQKICEFNNNLTDISTPIGNPQAHSSIREDNAPVCDISQLTESWLNNGDLSMTNTLEKSNFQSTVPQDDCAQGSANPSAGYKTDLNLERPTDKNGRKERMALRLAKSLNYMGSDTRFYERLSLIVADIALFRHSQTAQRSMVETRELRKAPPRLNKTM